MILLCKECKTRILVLWDVTLGHWVLPDVLKEHSAFIFTGQGVKKTILLELIYSKRRKMLTIHSTTCGPTCTVNKIRQSAQRHSNLSSEKNLVWILSSLEYCGQYSDSLQARWSRDPIPVGARLSMPIHTSPGAHPASYTTGTTSLPGG